MGSSRFYTIVLGTSFVAFDELFTLFHFPRFYFCSLFHAVGTGAHPGREEAGCKGQERVLPYALIQAG